MWNTILASEEAQKEQSIGAKSAPRWCEEKPMKVAIKSKMRNAEHNCYSEHNCYFKLINLFAVTII